MLPFVCFAYRSAPHAVTGYSPFTLIFGREVQEPLTLFRRQLLRDMPEDLPVCDFMDSLRTRPHGLGACFRSGDYSKLFAQGHQIIVFEPGPHKLDAQWAGPYKVLKKVTDVTYFVSTPERCKKSQTYHINSMRAWHEPVLIYTVQYCEEENEEDMVAIEPRMYPFETGGELTSHQSGTEVGSARAVGAAS